LVGRKKSSSMLVLAHGSEAQAAEGIWGGPRQKKLKRSAGSWRGAAQAVGWPIRGIERAKKLYSMQVLAQDSEAQAAEGFWGGAGKKVENCCWQLEGSSTGSGWASSKAEEGLESEKNRPKC
jgi:hypothetical protein